MNLIFIDREFKRLETLEEYIDYEYEPKSKLKIGKRNIYYLDLKNDFVDEVSTYGFSPFILEGYISNLFITTQNELLLTFILSTLFSYFFILFE